MYERINLISVIIIVLLSSVCFCNAFPEIEKRCAVCIAMVDEILHNLMKETPQADIPVGDQVRAIAR